MRGAEELGMRLDKVIAEVIAALKSDAERSVSQEAQADSLGR
jgi:predicted hydrolase (HD superfamily)